MTTTQQVLFYVGCLLVGVTVAVAVNRGNGPGEGFRNFGCGTWVVLIFGFGATCIPIAFVAQFTTWLD